MSFWKDQEHLLECLYRYPVSSVTAEIQACLGRRLGQRIEQLVLVKEALGCRNQYFL